MHISIENMTEEQKTDLGYYILESVWSYLNYNGHSSSAMRIVDDLSKTMMISVCSSAYEIAKFNASKWESLTRC